MSDYQNNNRGDWKLARQENRHHAAGRCIDQCKAMLAEVPDTVKRELSCPGKCTDYKPSKLFAHTLECSKCGDMVEDTVSDRILSQ